MGSSRGFVINAVDAGLFQGLDVGFCSGEAVFFTAVADEDEFGLLFKGGHVCNIGNGDTAAAENADVRESVKVREGDGASLHAAHGEAGHSAMR